MLLSWLVWRGYLPSVAEVSIMNFLCSLGGEGRKKLNKLVFVGPYQRQDTTGIRDKEQIEAEVERGGDLDSARHITKTLPPHDASPCFCLWWSPPERAPPGWETFHSLVSTRIVSSAPHTSVCSDTLAQTSRLFEESWCCCDKSCCLLVVILRADDWLNSRVGQTRTNTSSLWISTFGCAKMFIWGRKTLKSASKQVKNCVETERWWNHRQQTDSLYFSSLNWSFFYPYFSFDNSLLFLPFCIICTEPSNICINPN